MSPFQKRGSKSVGSQSGRKRPDETSMPMILDQLRATPQDERLRDVYLRHFETRRRRRG